MSCDKCVICLDDKLNLPIKLECTHIFCYICIKSVKLLNNKCPLCRSEISNKILENMTFDDCIDNELKEFDITWLYHGRDFGWWKFDPISNNEIEKMYKKYLGGDNNISNILIGNMQFDLYFNEMIQINKNGIKRKILRADNNDINNLMIKGIAGLKY